MHTSSKSTAQQRADQVSSFQAELAILEKEQIVTLDAPQRLAISDYHQQLVNRLAATFDIDTGNREKQLSLGMKIASFLGALGLAASVFFLFYQFWGRFSTASQVATLLAAPLVTLVAVIIVAGRDKTGYFSKLFGMVCLACSVLNLVMLGQIFNITPSPNAFLIWAIIALLLAYATDTRLLLAAGIIAFAGFISAKTGTWSGCYWLDFGERPENFFPGALILLAIPSLPHHRFSGFTAIYRVFSLLFFFLPVLVLANWGRISYLPLASATIENVYQVVGFVGSAIAIWAGIRKAWPEMVTTGNAFFTIFLFTKFYDWWWDWLPKYVFFFLIGLTAILMLLVFKRLRDASSARGEEVLP